MVSKLTVIFLIVLLLQLGILLVLLPWINFGSFGNWNENHLLALFVEKSGMPLIKGIVVSGWAKGAVTGVGILNIILAFVEISRFKQSVAALDHEHATKKD